MPQTTLDPSDAAELAGMLTFPAGWLPGSQKPVLGKSLAAYAGHPACNVDDLRTDLHRFAFLLGQTDGPRTLRRANPMITTIGAARPLDRILPAE
jgi:hypothetical protein